MSAPPDLHEAARDFVYDRAETQGDGTVRDLEHLLRAVYREGCRAGFADAVVQFADPKVRVLRPKEVK